MLLPLAFFGGILTILSLCILPVLPFVFARCDQPFRRSGLPILAGMALTFALIASLATVGGGWAVRANQFERIVALALFAVFGLTLLFSSLAESLSRPPVQLGNRLSINSDLSGTSSSGPSVLNSFLLGIGTGLLRAPCAGPILGLILSGAALSCASAHTAFLLSCLRCRRSNLAGGRSACRWPNRRRDEAFPRVEEWIRRILGVAVLAEWLHLPWVSIEASSHGFRRRIYPLLSRLVDRFQTATGQKKRTPNQTLDIADGTSDTVPATLPELSEADNLINSSPLVAIAGLMP